MSGPAWLVPHSRIVRRLRSRISPLRITGRRRIVRRPHQQRTGQANQAMSRSHLVPRRLAPLSHRCVMTGRRRHNRITVPKPLVLHPVSPSRTGTNLLRGRKQLRRASASNSARLQRRPGPRLRRNASNRNPNRSSEKRTRRRKSRRARSGEFISGQDLTGIPTSWGALFVTSGRVWNGSQFAA